MNFQRLRETAELVKKCLDGYPEFKRTGKTPESAYLALRELYVRTDGHFNDVWQSLYAVKNPPVTLPPVNDRVLKGVTAKEIGNAVNALNRDGYYVFPQRVDDRLCQELHEFSLRTPAYMQKEGYYSKEPEKVFDPHNPVAPIYRFDGADTLNQAAAQAIMADPILLNTTQQYFKSSARYCNVQMWWTSPHECDSPSSQLAQMYHWDMDRVRFLNFFIYLTDVGPNDGPHAYIRNSHWRKPARFRQNNFCRFSDAECSEHYPAEDFVQITGPRGTIMAVDGRGFHKATMPTEGNRLIYLVSLSSSLFGQNYPRQPMFLEDENARNAYRAMPGLFDTYDILKDPSQLKKRVPVGAGYTG